MAKKGKGMDNSAKRWHSGWGKEKKNRHVKKSSHGKFKSVEELENHRKKVSGTMNSKRYARRKARGEFNKD